MASDYLSKWDTGRRAPILDAVRRHYRLMRAAQHWSEEELHELQLRELRRLVRHAWRNVPLYADLWADEPRIEDWDDFRALPILERALVTEDPDRLVARSLPPGIEAGPPTSTSGSTGHVVRIRVSTNAFVAGAAAELLEMEWTETDPTESLGLVRTYSKGPEETVRALSKGVRIPRWAAGPLRELLPVGDGYLIDAGTPPEHVAAFFMAARPRRLAGYPTALLLASNYWEEPPAVSSIRCFGENLLDGDRSALERVFRSVAWNSWSAVETGPIAHTCPEDRERLHVHSPNVILEVVDDKGRPCAPGTPGSVLVTPLHQWATPLVRYRIGDWATLGACDCGRSFPALSSIEGRAMSQIRRKDGSSLMSPKLIDLLGAVPGLRRFQLLQHAWNRFEALLITDSDAFETVAQQVTQHVRKYVGDESVQVEPRRVEELPLSPSGKFEKIRWVGSG